MMLNFEIIDEMPVKNTRKNNSEFIQVLVKNAGKTIRFDLESKDEAMRLRALCEHYRRNDKLVHSVIRKDNILFVKMKDREKKKGYKQPSTK